MPLSVGAVVAVSSIIQSSLAFSILEGPSIYDVRAEEGKRGLVEMWTKWIYPYENLPSVDKGVKNLKVLQTSLMDGPLSR